MSHADPPTTNNRAEYDGLITGLKAARAHAWTPQEVVGDSMLILGQLKQYRCPAAPQLRARYDVARRLGDALCIRVWRHHPRAANTMADAAANLAMDTLQSSQVLHPTKRPEHQAIADMLANDLAQWRLGGG